MGIRKAVIEKFNTDILYEQLDKNPNVQGKALDFLVSYLFGEEICSLEDIDEDDLTEYRKYVCKMKKLSRTQKKYYMSLLEQACFGYYISANTTVMERAKSIIPRLAVRNKTVGFILMKGITDFNDIDYSIRKDYDRYLKDAVADSKYSEYMKAFDSLKLDAIRRNPFSGTNLKYKPEEVFLLYHPSIETAESFYYVQDKNDLVFDFSIDASSKLKHQVFRMLNHILETKHDRHDRRERFIIPLKLFYMFCADNGIEDIEQLSDIQVEDFRKSIAGRVGTKEKIYMQIVDNTRKFLFTSAGTVNWDANKWFLEGLSFSYGRMNPAREIGSFNFGCVEQEENRQYFKLYMKYLVGISSKCSLQTVRMQYHDINSFLRYLDENELSVITALKTDLKKYFKCIDDTEIQPEYFNRKIISVARFYNYLISKKIVSKEPVEFSYYLKKVFKHHNDRSVQMDAQLEILANLKFMPLEYRLMYLNLWCIGLRVNEVCTIKGDAYVKDADGAWIRIYQYKMRREKKDPIPNLLYETMIRYIRENNIRADEYVFRNRKGGAFCAETFCKNFKKSLMDIGITDYSFRSHDSRHTVATFLWQSGVPIETIRDYLGHISTDMTMQYIDFMTEIISESNDIYFKDHPELGEIALKGVRREKKDIS